MSDVERCVEELLAIHGYDGRINLERINNAIHRWGAGSDPQMRFQVLLAFRDRLPNARDAESRSIIDALEKWRG